jgi:hypothetical protein
MTVRSMSFDADERDDQPAQAVDPQASPEQGRSRGRRVPHAAQRQRDQRDDDQRVEDDRRRDRGRRAVQPHDVELAQPRVDDREHGRQHGEVLRHVVGDGERGQRTPGDQQLLADLDDLDELRRVRVQVQPAGQPGCERMTARRHDHRDRRVRQRERPGSFRHLGVRSGRGGDTVPEGRQRPALRHLLHPPRRLLVVGCLPRQHGCGHGDGADDERCGHRPVTAQRPGREHRAQPFRAREQVHVHLGCWTGSPPPGRCGPVRVLTRRSPVPRLSVSRCCRADLGTGHRDRCPRDAPDTRPQVLARRIRPVQGQAAVRPCVGQDTHLVVAVPQGHLQQVR